MYSSKYKIQLVQELETYDASQSFQFVNCVSISIHSTSYFRMEHIFTSMVTLINRTAVTEALRTHQTNMKNSNKALKMNSELRALYWTVSWYLKYIAGYNQRT